MPLSLYNGLWNGAATVPRFANLTFVGALPQNASFFKQILQNGSKAGMVMFEQDYICSSYATTSSAVGIGARRLCAVQTHVSCFMR